MIIDRVAVDIDEDEDGFSEDGYHSACGHFHAEYTVCPNEDGDENAPCGDYRCCINY